MRGQERWFFAAWLLLLGCSPGAGRPVDRREQALTADNGNGLNGNGLNGNGLNESGLGAQLMSVDFAGATLNGVPLDLTLSGSQLVGTAGGVSETGAEMAGTRLQGTSDSGNRASLRIAQVSREPAPDDDTWDYWVEYWDPVAQAWTPLCSDATGARPAYALQGYWSYAFGSPGGGGKVADPSRFDFACEEQGALGKCVGFGYAPWRTLGSGASLDPTHQACVRMVRADFCGEGVSYTEDGKQIDLYDWAGIQSDTESWAPEAEWDANGARCFSSVNRSSNPVPCYDSTRESGCGDVSHFQSGALLIDEIPAP